MLEGQPGWSWDWREYRWDLFITALTSFAGREGHLQVPQGHHEGDYPLGAKVAHTRGVHRSGRLSPQRQAELLALPGWTWGAQPSRSPRRRSHATGGLLRSRRRSDTDGRQPAAAVLRTVAGGRGCLRMG
ncbi:helicase associated domain-containing protein [Streptomyces sp. NPDC059718]